MRWINPVYSKSQIRKAGEVLRTEQALSDNILQAYEVLSNWRSAHAYPMHCLLIYLRRKSAEICKDPIVVQRLKRAPSIIDKLRRIPDMSLDRMQDISGCRSVVNNVAQVRHLSNAIKNSDTRHILHNEKDYIAQPKESGYRCIHLIYKYNASKKQYKNFFVELQLRSQVQHAWATAVEVVDIFTRQALKVSHGHSIWHNFFRYVCAEFARLERAPVDTNLSTINTLQEVKRIETELSVANKLRAFAVTTRHIEKQAEKGFQYYIMQLDTINNNITIFPYKATSISEATTRYLELETQYAADSRVNVVLVSGDSIKNLKKAYPNYFADTATFATYYEQILKG
jgi:ppGpp synthetase/RelA/SpoT-type nucleotidyltranferase